MKITFEVLQERVRWISDLIKASLHLEASHRCLTLYLVTDSKKGKLTEIASTVSKREMLAVLVGAYNLISFTLAREFPK